VRDTYDEQAFDLLDSILYTLRKRTARHKLCLSSDGGDLGGAAFGTAYGITPTRPIPARAITWTGLTQGLQKNSAGAAMPPRRLYVRERLV
jgi:hypothetical protein